MTRKTLKDGINCPECSSRIKIDEEVILNGGTSCPKCGLELSIAPSIDFVEDIGNVIRGVKANAVVATLYLTLDFMYSIGLTEELKRYVEENVKGDEGNLIISVIKEFVEHKLEESEVNKT